MPRRRRRSKASGKDEKPKDNSPTVFTAAGLLAFSEEDAIVKLKPIYILALSVGLIIAVLVFSMI